MRNKNKKKIINKILIALMLIVLLVTLYFYYKEDTKKEKQVSKEIGSENQLDERYDNEDELIYLSIKELIEQNNYVFGDNIGDAGKLYILEKDLIVNLYSAKENPQNLQEICDAENSAVFYDEGILSNITVIADHDYQGFDCTKEVEIGITKAYIRNKNSLKEYVAIKKFEGHNTETAITDWEYNIIYGEDNQILTYTCNETWENVTIVIWEEL